MNGIGAASAGAGTPWLTVTEAAHRARCGTKLIYREVKAHRLKAARVGGRRELRFLAEWIDDWLLSHCTPQPTRGTVGRPAQLRAEEGE